jgi:hypothetical protein
MAGISQDLQELLGVTGAALSGNIQVEVKTNYSPAITVYSGQAASSSGGSGGTSSSGNLFSRLMGLDAGVRVIDPATGSTLASYGDWPATDWVRVAIALGLVGLLGFGFVKLVRSI